ncbi:MAG: YceI family protein [Chitinophagaceae bacterium]
MCNLRLTFMAAGLFFVSVTGAQTRYFTKSGRIEFSSKAPLEDIEARNKTATAVLETNTGALQFSVLLKGFEFEKALMQEHFNENYVESDKFPKAEFKGSILNNTDISYSKPGTYNTRVKGIFTLHGVSKEITTTGTIKVNVDHLRAESTFNILLSDYAIKLSAIVRDKISNTIKVVVDTKLEPLK